MSGVAHRRARPEPLPVPADRYVLPKHLTTPETGRGPRFGDDVWDFRPFLPRTTKRVVVDFSSLPDRVTVLTAKQYLHSRLNRAVPAGRRSGHSVHPMKATGVVAEFEKLRMILAALRALGVERLADVSQEHLDAIVALWSQTVGPATLADRIGRVQHLAAHGAFLTADRLTFLPWRGRAAKSVAACARREENTTPRIPEAIMGPLLRAAVFYVQVASGDILAALDEVAALETARAGRTRASSRDAAARVRAFIDQRRRTGRGIPALPTAQAHTRPGTPALVVDGVVQAPNRHLIQLMSGVRSVPHLRELLWDAGAELGYEEGGLDTALAVWPDTGQPWRSRLHPDSLRQEVDQLRTACWIICAYLSGMRDAEVRELGRDCAFTAPGDGEDGRVRSKLRGRVFKGRKLSGDEADWVVLPIVHQAVEILLRINDDPTHLFGYLRGDTYRLVSGMPRRLRLFQDHVNGLFATAEAVFIPRDGELAWSFDTRQFRRTLAWHIAHQPFGVVAGAKQYQHAKATVFEGYAGTSASGFAAEVAAEEAVAMLDYVEDLYRDWNDGARSGGGAAERVNAEFERIRRELGDLPGVVADELRLRTMLKHLTKILHPGVLNDCFFNPATAVCVKRAKVIGRPVPQHNMCLRCPNARRSSVHLPRLTAARDQAVAFQAARRADGIGMPLLQQTAITNHITELTQAIAEILEPA